MKKILVALLVAMLAMIATVALAETHAHEFQYAGKDATCTEPGWQEVTCKDPECPYRELTTTPAFGHKYSDWIESKPAWCLGKGEEYCYCLNCGKPEVNKVREIPALGHTYSDWVVSVPATCTTEGEEYCWCTFCGDPNYNKTQKIPATGHVKFSEWISHADATCTAEGMNYRYCLACKTEKEWQEVPALGHKIVEGSESTNAKGEKVVFCERCYKYVKVEETVAPEAKPEVKPEDKPSKPATKPSTPNKPTTNKDGVTIPATGETMNVAPFIMMLVAIVGLAVTKQKVTE